MEIQEKGPCVLHGQGQPFQEGLGHLTVRTGMPAMPGFVKLSAGAYRHTVLQLASAIRRERRNRAASGIAEQ